MALEQKTAPYEFDEFFASGQDETISPFLTRSSKKWGSHLPLKASIVSAVCLALAFVLHFFFVELSYIFLLVVYALSGTPALIGAIEDLKELNVNIDVLMTLAALLSVLIGSGLEGALLLVLFELSGSLEEMVTHKTKSALISLHNLSPTKASVITEDGHLVEKSIKEIPLGSSLLVKAGEVVPLDGVVSHGSSFVNLSHLTGESNPLPKNPGDDVPAGARNLDGSLTLTSTTLAQDSTLSKIIHMVALAIESKPKLQQWIDTFGRRYATTIIGLTAFFALALPFFFKIPYLGVEGGIYRALSFLIAASPCALVIATPTAYLSAISACAKKGILLKGGVILDALSKCTSAAFDKTGTLTTGKLYCTKLAPLNEKARSMDINEVLSIAASMERHVKHPMADAIVSYAKNKKLALADLDFFQSIPGFGIQAHTNKSPCYIGNEAFISSHTDELIEDESLEDSTHTYFLLGEALFVFHFRDEIRTEAQRLIYKLHTNLNIKTAMLTGDHRKNALPVAKEIGIDDVYADLKPEDKLEKVASLAKERGLIMVGDGVNDAPALARSTVGISMGKVGSACAVDASDVVFLNDEIGVLDWLIKKSRQTLRIVKENLTLALSVILLVTTPALLGWVPLWLAVVLHEGGTVLVGLNSLRLLKQKM